MVLSITKNPSLAEIDACLPQTQCTRCTYPCCADYAAAIASGEAKINQCPPGGTVTIKKLAQLTGQTAEPLNPEIGAFQPKTLAYIIEKDCIGCVLCIKACPTDAIVGANKQMHTVISRACTGCELCLPVCPTDCIEMRAPPQDSDLFDSDWPGYSMTDITSGRSRFQQRQQRLAEIKTPKTQAKNNEVATNNNKQTRQQAILDAVNRRRQQRP